MRNYCAFLLSPPVGEQCQIARPPPPLVTTTTCKDLAIVIYDITCSREGTISQASIILFSSRTSTSSRAEIQSTLKKDGGSFLSPSNTGNNFLSDSLNVQVEKLVDIGVSTVDGLYVGTMKSMLKAWMGETICKVDHFFIFSLPKSWTSFILGPSSRPRRPL